MNISELLKRGEKLTIDNSPLLLTALGVVGTIGTSVLTGRAAFRASQRIADREFVVKTHPTTPYGENNLETKEKIALVWKDFVPPVASGVVTITAIIFANRISTKRAAAMAAAFALSEKNFGDYQDKIKEKLGVKKEEAVSAEIAQENANANPVGKNVVYVTGGGDVLFYDHYAGRYFNSSMETVRKAENDVNFDVLHNDYCTLNDFYERVGLSRTAMGEEIGWTTDQQLSISYDTIMSDDNRPCISINYRVTSIRRKMF